jgi:diguanylate cyclase (GGDEF)-like protein
MWNIILLPLWLKKTLNKSFAKIKDDYQQTIYKYDILLSENAKLKDDNAVLEKTLSEITTLYNITKNICRSLDENKVFEYFREEINRYLEVSDCKFLKHDVNLSEYTNYSVLPLHINNTCIGYLATSRIKEEEKDKFHILSQQFLLGIKRALLYQKIQELAIRDSLTQVFSRRYLLERLGEEIERSIKFKYKFSFLMIDIDNFKDYNDRYGHLVGDAILREVTNVIKENIRQIDLVGRYGGEEFSIILTETDEEQARYAAERIRQAIADKVIKIYDEQLKVTISIGISIFPYNADNVSALIDTADQALYRSKELGRNKVCVYGDKV